MLILNDIQVDVLEALMTYMYQGTVSVPHNKLQVNIKLPKYGTYVRPYSYRYLPCTYTWCQLSAVIFVQRIC